MTDEEKQAIEFLKKRMDICLENADICDENDFDEEAICLRKEQILIETVLNLIEKQQSELEKKDKLIEYWKNGFERELEANRSNIIEIVEQDSIIRKKDKIIDYICDYLSKGNIIQGSKQKIREYFEEEV